MTDKVARNTSFVVEILTPQGIWESMLPRVSLATRRPASLTWKRHRGWLISAGLVFTGLLHLGLIGTALLGNAGRLPTKPSPLTEGGAATLRPLTAEKNIEVVLLNDPKTISMDQMDEDVPLLSVSISPPNDHALLVTTQHLETPIAVSQGSDDNAIQPQAAGDEQGNAVMFGRYMGQIKARIERAWLYPTTHGEEFSCTANIKQNVHGDVQEITLSSCDADPAWQTSLAQAIQQASPLSAPPDDALFSERVTLHFWVRLPTVAVSTEK